MVRTSKPASASAAAASSTSAPVKALEVKSDASAAKKAPKAPKNTVVVAETPVAEPEQPESGVEGVDETSTTASKVADFNLKLQQVVALVSALKLNYKGLEKAITRDLKTALKASSKKSKRSGNRQPSGFVRPTLISTELADFLGRSHGSEMARTEVSKEINKYIRDQSLQDKDNGRQINADAKLKTLLKLEDTDVLTYFNLQRYMKHHFIKTTPVVAPVAHESTAFPLFLDSVAVDLFMKRLTQIRYRPSSSASPIDLLFSLILFMVSNRSKSGTKPYSVPHFLERHANNRR